MKEPKYWTCNDSDEVLTAESIDDAIENFVSCADKIPRKMTVHGYSQIDIAENTAKILAASALESMIECLDEDYGNPEECSEITPEMENMAQEFAEKIIGLYHVWSCEKVKEVEVDMIAWCKENEPDALEIIEDATPPSV